MEIEYLFRTELLAADPLCKIVVDLLAAALENSSVELAADLAYQQQRSPLQLWLALADGQVIGCKLGYERKPAHYYSWLGGVHPGFRGQGIARELLRQQHAWCQQQGYNRIRTQTYNHWRAMLLLNLRAGFDIVGTVQSARGLVIVLEKELAA
ncbi:GNAT family N-acetyltransferase [uncultured Hymenobacter sp.]|uniref:GNAT family N-acetyltransferase n=1 Tax=uncultured Hymenobacter sp. TaxID=170016 RepID=UPI0035CB3A71